MSLAMDAPIWPGSVAGVAHWSVTANVPTIIGAGPQAFHVRELAGPVGRTASGPYQESPEPMPTYPLTSGQCDQGVSIETLKV